MTGPGAITVREVEAADDDRRLATLVEGWARRSLLALAR